MVILRTDIERALDELASQEEGMRFQGLAVVLGKMRWPELIARQRKKDLGLDAYAPASQTPEGIGKGLAASITPTLNKIAGDATTAKEHFQDLKALLFVTSAKVGNADRRRWEQAIRQDHGIELCIIEREEIITLMMMPENASLRASFLHLDADAGPHTADLVERTRRAAGTVMQSWAGKAKGSPLIELASVRLDPDGKETADVLSLEQMGQMLSQSQRVVLEGPAGCGKTTTLVQLAARSRTTGIAFIVELPAWTSSRREILEYIAGMPSFRAEGLTSTDLARVQQTEPFLFLLNGWNEIAESNSTEANEALRELERNFPSAGIIVATRTHHLVPPLPGTRLRLLRLNRAQRSAYLASRLGANGAGLRDRIAADHALDELTRTPFILGEVAALFEAGADIPSTKIGILAEVIRLQEVRDEHRNALQSAPIFGQQSDYLKAIATEMTRRGTVSLPEADARTHVAAVARGLAERGQITPVGAPAVLAALTAHHILERIDYPRTTFQFAHQQLQEYFAALDLRTRLLAIDGDDRQASDSFTADYVNLPAWAESLRMIAQTFAGQTGDAEANNRDVRAGATLVEMALAVDPVFAAELARLCGSAVWNEVRAAAGGRLRTILAVDEENHQQYAVAAMLASGADDFKDILVPLLSTQDQQTRLRTYRLWPDFHVSSLGANWREVVIEWSDEARESFVSELLHHRLDGDIALFAAEDASPLVKKAAASALFWIGSVDALVQVLGSMDRPTFEETARRELGHMPEAIKPNAIAALRGFIASTADNLSRLRTALDLIAIGEQSLDEVVKEAMTALSPDEVRNLSSHFVEPALEYMSKADAAWAAEWVVTRVAEGSLYRPDDWLAYAKEIPFALIETYLHLLENQDLGRSHLEGMIAVVGTQADHHLAARVFAKLRSLQSTIDASPKDRNEFEWQVVRQLQALFERFPGDSAAAGILMSVTDGDPLDIKVSTDLLTRAARPELEPLQVQDEDLKANLRAYLKNAVSVALLRDDFTGQLKANLASAIAQVGQPEDVADLVTLIHADIARVRRGRAARAAGDRGPLSDGSTMSYSGWHVAALMLLDPSGATPLLVDLLVEPEYRSDAAAAMARDFLPKQGRLFDRGLRYELMWAARESATSQLSNDPRRMQFAVALRAEIVRLIEEGQDGKAAPGAKDLAKALAAVDGHGSSAAVLQAMAMPGKWDEYVRLDTAQRLLLAGVVLPATAAFAIVDSILERTSEWLQDSDRHLLCRTLALCPFVDDPAAGIAKVREVLGQRRLRGYDLRDLVAALGESRSDSATDLLYELASDTPTFEQCGDCFLDAFAALDTSRTRELLMGFVDPSIQGIVLKSRRHHHYEDLLVARLGELAKRSPQIRESLLQLCKLDLPETNRHVLSKVMQWLDTPDALAANLDLIDDEMAQPVPYGLWDQLRNSFVEQRPHGAATNVFTEHAQASNELRLRLFRMTSDDDKRRKSASMLLAQIEVWRLEYGRPADEPRHPDFVSGQPWPP